MEYLSTEEKISFLRNNIEAIEIHKNETYYRAAATLTDGTYLPCVIFRNPQIAINQAIEEFERGQAGKLIVNNSPELGYQLAVKNIVTHGNRVNVYDVAVVEPSKYTFPLQIRRQIKGETTMGWTGFSAKMKDGSYIGFGTTNHIEFFDMPEKYTPQDIEEIINHSYVLKSGELRFHKLGFLYSPDDYEDAVVYMNRSFFECFIDDL